MHHCLQIEELIRIIFGFVVNIELDELDELDEPSLNIARRD